MDKYEYKVRADEIKDLIADGRYAQAAEIADVIDWRRVKSVMMLCTISDLYKINRRYEDAKNVLLLAYERRPGGRTICYSLCELCLKTGEFDQAIKYYKEFVQVAPKDTGRYILQYKIYEAQDDGHLEDRISVLEELKKRDLREKWVYELALLYYRVGFATKCVEVCDELILWFGEGKYVWQAMELKRKIQPLTPEQQEKYDHRFDSTVTSDRAPREPAGQEQAAIEWERSVSEGGENDGQEERPETVSREEAALKGDTLVYETIRRSVPENPPMPENAAESPARPEELDIQVKTMDMGKYNTINLQAELAAGLKEVLGEDRSKSEAITRSIVAPMLDTESLDFPELEDEDINEDDVDEGVDRVESTEVFFGETGDLSGSVLPEPDLKEIVPEEEKEPDQPEQYLLNQDQPEQHSSEQNLLNQDQPEQDPSEQDLLNQDQPEQDPSEQDLLNQDQPKQGLPGQDHLTSQRESGPLPAAESSGVAAPANEVRDKTAEMVMNQLRRENTGKTETQQVLMAQPPKGMAEVLSQESDGQISLVIPEKETVEKQITGQMNIEDILSEWERLKQESQERREEEVRQRVLQQTGNLFSEFDASVKDGLLEQLENGADEAELEEPEESLEETAAESAEPEFVEEPLDETVEELSESEIAVEPEELEETTAESTETEIIEEPLDETVEEVSESEIAEEPLDETVEEVPESEIAVAPEAAEESLEETATESIETEIIEEPLDETVEEVPESEIAEEPKEIEEPLEETAAESTETEIIEEPLDETAEEVSESETAVEPEELEETTPELTEAEEPETTEEPLEETAAEPTEPEKAGKSEETRKSDSKDSESRQVEREKAKVRSLTPEEKELFAPYIQSRSAREQLIKAIDNISLAAYTGNVIITGDEGMDTATLAKNMIREVQLTDRNFSGKVAKISGQALNGKKIGDVLAQLKNGALMIQKASGMDQDSAGALRKELQRESLGIIIVMEDTRKAMEKFLKANPDLSSCFTARMNVEALSDDMLVAFGRHYAKGREYAIDELGMLALHTKIEERQTIDHAVTVLEVKAMVDEAIRHASRKTLGHFVDVLLGRRYNEEDMILLTEKDFV